MATLEQIAVKAGVSRDTVARALSGRTKAVWPSAAARVERIQKIASELGYRPNVAARATSTGKFNAIGVLRSTEASSGGMGPGALWTLEQEAQKQGMHLVTGQVADDKLTDADRVPLLLREWAADGLIISYSLAPQRMIDLLEQYRMPGVWVNTDREHDCILPDETGGVRTATEHLLALGHRRILFYGVSDGAHFSAPRRYQAYRDTMRHAGLKPSLLEEEDVQARHERVLQLLRSPDRPTAILCLHRSGSLFASALMAGLSVPDDLSILVLRDPAHVHMGAMEDTFVGRPISAIELPGYAMGRESFRMLMRKIENPAQHLPSIRLPFTLVKGGTCAPPKSPASPGNASS